GLARAETGADAAFRIVSAVEIEFQSRLQDQTIRQQQIGLRLDPERRPARTADVRGRLHVEPVRREPLNADCRPGARRTRAEVMTHAGHELPPSRDGTAVERIHLAGRQGTVPRPALGPEAEAVDVAADPALAVPADLRVA